MEKSEEKQILIKTLGLLYALKNKAITIDESEQYLFCPREIKKITAKKPRKNIIELLECCCELEDIKSLLPEIYETKLDEFILTVIKELETI